MAGIRRLQKELSELKDAAKPSFCGSIEHDESNFYRWTVLLQPNAKLYETAAFRVQIEFPTDYPFKPPAIKFLTRVYHPNIANDGKLCIPLINADHWKPSTRMEQVLNALHDLICTPDLDHPLRPEIADEFKKNRPLFEQKVAEHIAKFAESRQS